MRGGQPLQLVADVIEKISIASATTPAARARARPSCYRSA